MNVECYRIDYIIDKEELIIDIVGRRCLNKEVNIMNMKEAIHR